MDCRPATGYLGTGLEPASSRFPPMDSSTPQYLLACEAGRPGNPCQWRFTLRTPDGRTVFEADDEEPGVSGDRLELLTVVRGLEALDQPACVTLVNPSACVRQGMLYGLPEWRESDWRWECFGQMVPVKNADLWQRLDHILEFHHVRCIQRRFDSPHSVPGHHTAVEQPASEPREPITGWANWLKCTVAWVPPTWRAATVRAGRRGRTWLSSNRRIVSLAAGLRKVALVLH